MYPKSENCVEHPLGILCKCIEYQDVINKFKSYNFGTQHYLLPKMNVEPIASAKVSWIKNRLKLDEDISKPVLGYPCVQSSINTCNVDKLWTPTLPDVIPLKLIKLSWNLW